MSTGEYADLVSEILCEAKLGDSPVCMSEREFYTEVK